MIGRSTEVDDAVGSFDARNQLQSSCALLLLPAELRICIFKWALTRSPDARHDLSKVFGYGPPVPQPVNPNRSLSTALLRTCHQIHDESHDMLFTQNTIIVRHFNDLDRLEWNVGASKMSIIRAVQLYVDPREAPKVWSDILLNMNAKMYGLTELEVHFVRHRDPWCTLDGSYAVLHSNSGAGNHIFARLGEMKRLRHLRIGGCGVQLQLPYLRERLSQTKIDLACQGSCNLFKSSNSGVEGKSPHVVSDGV